MKYDEIICKLFGFSVPTYYNWKKDNRPIIKLIDKYFTANELLEFIDKSEISKYELFSSLEYNIVDEYIDLYTNIIGHQSYYEKLYWDFIYRFKTEIIKLENYNIKENFQTLLFEYQSILIKISEKIDFPTIEIMKKFNTFYNIFDTKDDRFFILLSNLLEHDFIYYNHVMDKGNLFPREYKDLRSFIKKYKDKSEINLSLKDIKNINSYSIEMENPIDENDFFIAYQNYLEKKHSENSPFTQEDYDLIGFLDKDEIISMEE